MPSSAPSAIAAAARRCSSAQLVFSTAARVQRRSLSSQCLRITSSSSSTIPSRRRRQQQQQQQRRWQSSEAAAAGPEAATSPKIQGIVEQISGLTLLETADLVASLKKSLNIPDISFAAPAAAGPAAGGAAAGTAAAAAAEEEAPAEAAAEKTMFTLKLESFEATAKPKIIKEVKSMLGLSLVDSKKFVESAPKVLKDGVPKEEAEKIKKLLEGLGAKVSMD